MMTSSTHEIVILGANFAGVNINHYLHRQIFPVLKRLDSSLNFHTTIVSPNSHFFFKIASPRALTKAKAIPNDDIFKSLTKAFEQYGDANTFVQGKAISLETKEGKRTVEVEVTGSGKQTLHYDSLFICTGTTSNSPLWTLHDDHTSSVQALQEMQDRLPKIKSVLIAGAGPVGVETSGEIASAHPHIKITLVASGEPLEKQKVSRSTISKAKRQLADAKVDILTRVRVKDTSLTASGTTVELSNGSSMTVDLFIDARGASKVNSEFIPSSWLDHTRRVKADKGFRVTNGDGPGVSGVYVVGDIVAGSLNTAIELDAQVPTAASSFAVDLAAKLGSGTSSGGLLSWIPGFGGKGPVAKEFKPMNAIFVPIGPEKGIGQVMGFGVPTFMVKKGKSERFLMELVEPAVTGTKYAQL